jgi:hypothetical protein
MLVRNARRAAKAANLVRSAMDPRDIDALTPLPNAGNDSRRESKIAPAGVRANSGKLSKTALNPLKPGGEEAVEPAQARVGVGPVARQGAQVAVGFEEIRDAGHFAGGDRLASHTRFAR